MIRVPVPLNAFEGVKVTLSGVQYTLSYSFNESETSDTVDGRWYCNIKDSDGQTLVNGLKIMESAPIDIHLRYGLPDGFLYVYQIEADAEKAGRHNVGIGKSYELMYTTYDELS